MRVEIHPTDSAFVAGNLVEGIDGAGVATVTGGLHD